MGRMGWVVGALLISASALGCGKFDGHHPSPAGPVADAGVEKPPLNQADYPRAAADNPIPAENARPGSPDWRSGAYAVGTQLLLYTDTESVEAGGSVSVKVSTDVALSVTAEVFRIGHYQGTGARRVWSAQAIQVAPQGTCPRDARTARVECGWQDAFSFVVGADWVSGYYLVKVTRPDGIKRFHPFVVRDHRAAEVLFQPGFNTYQAYNRWGGESLYDDGSHTLPGGRAYEVSYNRPYDDEEGTGQFFSYEYAFIIWLEKQGYDVTYGSNLDFTRFKDFLQGVGAFLQAGHDEYWTSEERATIDAALARGKLSLLYFGGNGGYWRVRAEPDFQARPFRTLVCYKNRSGDDPLPGTTVRYRDPPNSAPENALYGVMYESWMLANTPLVVKDASRWLFAGTGLRDGDTLEGLEGGEYDNIQNNGWSPPGLGIDFETPVYSADGFPGMAQGVDRMLPSGTLVFSAGTFLCSWGLEPSRYDARVARMTLNLLERALAHRRPEKSLPEMHGPFPTVATPVGTWARSVDAYVGSVGGPGTLDGAGVRARFSGPTGVTVMPNGEVAVADTLGNRIRLVGTDGMHSVVTIAGTGDLGGRDGAGAQAMFRLPDGIVAGPGGSIFVADSDNHAIRRLDRTGAGWTVSTYAGQLRTSGLADAPVRARPLIDLQRSRWTAPEYCTLRTPTTAPFARSARTQRIP